MFLDKLSHIKYSFYAELACVVPRFLNCIKGQGQMGFLGADMHQNLWWARPRGRRCVYPQVKIYKMSHMCQRRSPLDACLRLTE